MSTGSPPGHLAEMSRLDEEVGASLVATEAYMGTALDGPDEAPTCTMYRLGEGMTASDPDLDALKEKLVAAKQEMGALGSKSGDVKCARRRSARAPGVSVTSARVCVRARAGSSTRNRTR